MLFGMLRKTFLSMLTVVFLFFGGFSQRLHAGDTPIGKSALSPSVSSLPFEIGERFIFRLRYGFVKAGMAEMKVLALNYKDDGDAYYHIQSTARSIGAFDWLYKVRDVVNSYMDSQTLYPIHSEKLLQEGGYKAYTFVDYFQRDSVAKVKFIRYAHGNKIKKKISYQVKIPSGVFDALSAFYFVRTLKLEPGKSVFITSYENKYVYNLEIKVHKRETIKVKAGTFRCLKIEPLLKGEGIFKHKGTLNIWVTDDSLKIPIQMTTEIIVGHITAELVKIEGVSKPIPAKIK